MFTPFSASRCRLTRAAFTLIELLVSMTVTLLLVVALMQIFNAATNTWQHGEAQVDAFREARGALQLMARDLSATLAASYSQTTGTVPASYSPLLPTLVLQHGVTGYTPEGGPTNEEVYCLTNIPDDQAFPTPASTPAGATATSGSTGVYKMSSMCAVGYYCQWLPEMQNATATVPHAFALMRQSLRSNDTFQRVQAAGGTGKPLDFDSLFSPTISPKPFVNQLAAYVWDLRFRIDTDLNEVQTPDGNLPSPYDHSSPQPRSYNGTPGTLGYPPNLPPYVEIRFKALSDLAGRRLEGNASVQKSDWLDTSTTVAYRTIIQPNAQQFVLRVPLINAASVAATPNPTPTP